MTTDDPMSGKVSFDGVYDRPDPRTYFRTLATLDYQIPEHARGPFAYLAQTIRDRRDGDPVEILDLCCSYGINAMLLNHDVSLADLYDRYRDAELESMSSDELIAADREFFAQRLRPDALPVVGLDAASSAVDYALRVGLLHAGSDDDLERTAPGEVLVGHLARVGLITVTGGIGYITETTFERLLESASTDDPPWIAAFSLRWFDMSAIRAVLRRHGFTLELLDGRTFRQRRFASDEERQHAFTQLHRLGLDPDVVESDGYHHTVFYLARPAQDAADVPVNELLAPVL